MYRGEGQFSASGALAVETGRRTGRSPKDRFIVLRRHHRGRGGLGRCQPAGHSWRVSGIVEPGAGAYGGARDLRRRPARRCRSSHYLPIRVTTEYAWHALFARSLFIAPEAFNPQDKTVWEVVNAPEFTCDPARDGTPSDATVMIDFTGRRVLLAGLRYAGEMKKALFGVQNFLLPAQDVLPMHCSANMGADGDVTLFFRPLRHRQDHPLGSSRTPPHRRRRARLGAGRRVQPRRRLLTPSALASREKPNPSSTMPSASAPSSRTWC